jgi:uncharacterized protein (DUF362 family)
MVEQKSKVSIVRVREQDTYAALEQAIELIDGIEDVLPSGSRVLIKPNFTMGPTERGITNPVVIEAVLRLVSATSPRSIVIGEGAGDSYTWLAFRMYNIYDIASRYGARVMDLNVDEGVRREVPEETGREYVMLPRTVAESDVVVSVPNFKLWMDKLPMTLSLKNLFGLYGARYYGHNKNSHELAEPQPHRTLAGEVGSERGIHYPSVEQSIAAINLARPSDLTVVDALEGSDGKGNYVRMDLLMAGRNAVATDSVALAVAGFTPIEQEQIRLCSQMGLGPGRLEDIDVRGEAIERVHFDLGCLKGNVIEMPLGYCLDRVSLGELAIMASALKMHGFLDENVGVGSAREDIIGALLSVMSLPDYLDKAVASLPQTGQDVLRLLLTHGGTSGDYYDILREYLSSGRDSNSFWAGLRSLLRLGLAFLFHGQYKCYVVLAEGVPQTL